MVELEGKIEERAKRAAEEVSGRRGSDGNEREGESVR